VNGHERAERQPDGASESGGSEAHLERERDDAPQRRVASGDEAQREAEAGGDVSHEALSPRRTPRHI
jgi:hypothetical protein